MLVPRVSVLMANYNGERFLASAIVSVLEQSYKDFELIVIDDGSTDSSPAIIRSFALQDSRVRGFYFSRNKGLVCSLNYGLAKCRGQYVARTDSNDLCHRERLAKQVFYLDRHPDIFVLGCRMVNIDEWDKRINTIKWAMPFSCGRLSIARRMADGEYPIAHATLMVRKFCFEELKGYRKIFLIGEDIDLCARLLDRYGAVFENLSERLYYYRRYKESLTRQHNFSKHAWIQTLVMYSAHCRRTGLPDPLDKASSLDLSSLPVSSSERHLLQAWYFFHRLHTLPANREERVRLLNRARTILEKSFSPEDARRFPYPYLQLARASAKSGDLLLLLRMLVQAFRSDAQKTFCFLLRKAIFLLRESGNCVLRLNKYIFYMRKRFVTTLPHVSVVMTSYNRARYLSKAIESWQRQTFSNFELIIVDDGSSDSTKRLLRNFVRSDHRIRSVFLPRNYGIPYAANRGLDLVRAPLIARADSDDIALPRRLQRQVRYMDLHPRVVALGCLCGKITKENGFIMSKVLLRRRHAIVRALTQGGVPLVHSSVILRRSSLPEGCYKNFFKLGGEDYDLFLRMKTEEKNHLIKPCFDNLPELLMLYREHASRTTRRHRKTIDKNHAYALFSARRRARGLSDPLATDKDWDPKSLQKLMTDKERNTFVADVEAQQLLSSMSCGALESEKVVERIRNLRVHFIDKGRFVWLALSAARNQMRQAFYVRTFLCLWEALRSSPLWTFVTLYDVAKTRRYDV